MRKIKKYFKLTIELLGGFLKRIFKNDYNKENRLMSTKSSIEVDNENEFELNVLNKIIPICKEESNLNVDDFQIQEKYCEHYNFLIKDLFPCVGEGRNVIWNIRDENRMGFWIDSCQAGNKFISLDLLTRDHKLKFCFFHGPNREYYIKEFKEKYPYKIITDKVDKNIIVVYFDSLVLNDDMKKFISDSYNKKHHFTRN